MAKQLLLLRYQETMLGLPAELAREVVEIKRVFPMPGGQGGLAGLVLVGGSALPFLDLHRLAGLPRRKTSLGLVIHFAEQDFVLPIDEVIGNLQAEHDMGTNDLISPPLETEDYRYDFKIRLMNPPAIISTLQARLTPV